MTERTRIGLAILPVAALVGVLGDQLLRAMPWGLNVTICTIALVAGATWIVRARRLPVTPDAPWLGITALLCAVAFVRRDSPALQFLDLLGVILVLALGALSLQAIRLRLRGVTAYPLALLRATGAAIVGSLPLLAADIGWAEVPRPARMGQLRAVALGVVLALPLLAPPIARSPPWPGRRSISTPSPSSDTPSSFSSGEGSPPATCAACCWESRSG